jgi:isoleucyl-tRNA synthetase
MAKNFPEHTNLNLSEVNKQILDYWKDNDTFRQSIETREGAPSFVFYEGPPSANGMPGIHHVMARTIKDVFCRYKTMQGFQVKRKAGWDTHGLPVELAVEKMLGITKEDIGKKISVDEYNAACRREVMKYTREWEDLTTKMGYWVDMEHPYITFDNKYIETLWHLLKQLYDKGLLYKGYTIQPYSPAAGTGLSSHELNQPGCYRDVKDLTCVAMFKLKAPLNPPSGGDLARPTSETHLNKLYNTANPVSYEILKENAKKRRKNPTEAENFLWKNLQGKQLDNYKFRREHAIGDFIVDFVCLSKQLVIEVDGGYHNDENQQEFDEIRTEYINSKGFKVIRFTNEDVLNNIENTLETIKVALRQSPPEGDLGGLGCYFLAWTTTPWTLPSNTALCVGANIDYVKIKTQNPYSKEDVYLILAEVLVPSVLGKNEYEILEKYKGKDLEGLEYEQLIPFVKPPKSPKGDFSGSTNAKNYSYVTADPALYGKLKELAKEHRNNPTPAENTMWLLLSGKKLDNYKFRRQHIIGDFIVDFVNLENKLVIEIDGGYHNEPDAAEYDKERAEWLEKNGYQVIRFTNEEVQNTIDEILEKISSTLKGRKSPLGDLGGFEAFKVITGDFVTTEDGTGIVHIAPTFGADDDKVAKQNDIAPMLLLDKNGKKVPMVDLTGKFYKIEDLDADFVKTNVDAELYRNYAGKFVKDAYYNELAENHISLDLEICFYLQERGLLFKREKHTHNYPHCWRTDKPVLYYPLDSWFIRTTAVKDEMIALNNTINWKPQSTGTGRFGKWLENLNDWNLSRSRYWGTPLPIWRTEDGTEEICIGSLEELFAEIEKSVAASFMQENPYPKFMAGDYTAENYAPENIDLHRPYVDNIVLVSQNGKPMKRELDLIDVWFDSGAMPFAQLHWPFEN